jgi:hypothetical protein
MHSFEQIIKNQTEFKENILSFFSKERAEVKKILNNIYSNDDYIVKEKNKLKSKFDKIKPKPYIERLFFLSSNRSTTFYVWWDEEEKEAKIFKYDKR